MRRARPGPLPILTSLLVALVCACHSAPADPVEHLLAEMTAAVGHKDADAIVDRLAPTFSGEAGIDRVQASAELRRYFSLYESVEIGLAEVATQRQPAGTTVRFRAAFAGKPKNIGGLAGLLPDAARYRFELTLVGEGRDLKIGRASWQPAERPQ